MTPEVRNLMLGQSLIEKALGLCQCNARFVDPLCSKHGAHEYHGLPTTLTVFNSTGPHACTNDTGCGLNPCTCRRPPDNDER